MKHWVHCCVRAMMNFGWHGPAPNATRIVSVVVSRMFEETCVWHTTNSLEVVCEHEFREHTQYVAQKVHHWRRRDSYHDATLFALPPPVHHCLLTLFIHVPLTWFAACMEAMRYLWVCTRVERSRLPDPPAWPGTQRDTDRVGGRKQDV